MLDSGSEMCYTSGAVVDSINSAASVVQQWNNFLDLAAKVPCSFSTSSASFTWTFGGPKGANITVPISDFVLPWNGIDVLTDNSSVCTFGFQETPPSSLPDEILVFLGEKFLRSAYTVFDLDNRVIALAQASNAPTKLSARSKADLQEIREEKDGIPGVDASLPLVPWSFIPWSTSPPFVPWATSLPFIPWPTSIAEALSSVERPWPTSGDEPRFILPTSPPASTSGTAGAADSSHFASR